MKGMEPIGWLVSLLFVSVGIVGIVGARWLSRINVRAYRKIGLVHFANLLERHDEFVVWSTRLFGLLGAIAGMLLILFVPDW